MEDKKETKEELEIEIIKAQIEVTRAQARKINAEAILIEKSCSELELEGKNNGRTSD